MIDPIAIYKAIEALSQVAEEMPSVVRAVGAVVEKLQHRQDPTPELMHLEIVAASHALGLDDGA